MHHQTYAQKCVTNTHFSIYLFLILFDAFQHYKADYHTQNKCIITMQNQNAHTHTNTHILYIQIFPKWTSCSSLYTRFSIHKYQKYMHKFHTNSPSLLRTNFRYSHYDIAICIITPTKSTIFEITNESNTNTWIEKQQQQEKTREANWIVFVCSKYFSMCNYQNANFNIRNFSGRINDAIS